jgi:hypothetical protein
VVRLGEEEAVVENLADCAKNRGKAQIVVGSISKRTYLPAHKFPISISFPTWFLVLIPASKSINSDILLERGEVHVRTLLNYRREQHDDGGEKRTAQLTAADSAKGVWILKTIGLGLTQTRYYLRRDRP